MVREEANPFFSHRIATAVWTDGSLSFDLLRRPSLTAPPIFEQFSQQGEEEEEEKEEEEKMVIAFSCCRSNKEIELEGATLLLKGHTSHPVIRTALWELYLWTAEATEKYGL